uniref:Uncharacterized protein n=1 Tax=Methanosarcina barkeri (strain Fusaro / DSM 804) TaxID=269797 RepID=Q46AI8_METBF
MNKDSIIIENSQVQKKWLYSFVSCFPDFSGFRSSLFFKRVAVNPFEKKAVIMHTTSLLGLFSFLNGAKGNQGETYVGQKRAEIWVIQALQCSKSFRLVC